MTRLVRGSHLFNVQIHKLLLRIIFTNAYKNHFSSLSKLFERTRNCESPSVSKKMRLPLSPWIMPLQQPI